MPPLGFITKEERTPEQEALHDACVKKMVRFALAPKDVPVGTKIMLSDFWNKPEVVADTGMTWDRTPFHQVSGSCVGAGGGNALFTLICVQRCLSEGATKAFIPFWPFNYGRCRALEGDRGQGDGAMGSAFASQLKEGVIAHTEAGLPKFRTDDGLMLYVDGDPNAKDWTAAYKKAASIERAWSDGNSALVKGYLDEAMPHPLGSAAEMHSPQDMMAAAVNGYPGSFACDYFISSAQIRGSGNNARVVGKWDTQGGHQQFFLGYENNADLGPLYLIGNNWPRQVYPRDPGGAPLVTCWVTESDVTKAFRYNAEVYAFSHLEWFPAQPEVIDWSQI